MEAYSTVPGIRLSLLPTSPPLFRLSLCPDFDTLSQLRSPLPWHRHLYSIFHFLTTVLLLLLLLSRFSCVRLCDPIDGSPPGSPIPGILQARTLEWVAISFSNAWKGKVQVKSPSCVRLLATPWTAAHQALPSMGFSRQEYWSGVSLPSPFNNCSFI